MKIQEVSQSKKQWIFCDYLRMTDDDHIVVTHFIKDYIFKHNVRCMIFYRIGKLTNQKLLRLFCDWKLLRLSRKFGLEIRVQTDIEPGLCLTHPYNITISPFAKIGRNVNISKGATIGISAGKRSGAPVIGSRVFIGINAAIVGGIKIGNDVMIAPNTFINEDIPSHSVVLGNPCKIIPKENASKEYISYLQ